MKLDDGVLRLRIMVDQCSVEVFAQDGRVDLSDLVFPLSGSLCTDARCARCEHQLAAMGDAPSGSRA